jgi:hypothetical protein
MLRKLFLFIVIFAVGLINAEPMPSWVRTLPTAPRGANYTYIRGIGFGEREHIAFSDAIRNAERQAISFIEGLIREGKADSLRVRTIGESAIRDNLLCDWTTKSGEYKIYVLMRIENDGRLKSGLVGNREFECFLTPPFAPQGGWLGATFSTGVVSGVFFVLGAIANSNYHDEIRLSRKTYNLDTLNRHLDNAKKHRQKKKSMLGVGASSGIACVGFYIGGATVRRNRSDSFSSTRATNSNFRMSPYWDFYLQSSGVKLSLNF